jgi:hypothetical protein
VSQADVALVPALCPRLLRHNLGPYYVWFDLEAANAFGSEQTDQRKRTSRVCFVLVVHVLEEALSSVQHERRSVQPCSWPRRRHVSLHNAVPPSRFTHD